MNLDGQTMEKIVALCRRRGFIFGSSEIYGGIGGFWDYGPLGTELKRNIKDAWWNDMVRNPPPGPDGVVYQMVGVDCSIIMNPKVWEASGHVGGFADQMVDCSECRKRFRADQVFRVVVVPYRHSDLIASNAVYNVKGSEAALKQCCATSGHVRGAIENGGISFAVPSASTPNGYSILVFRENCALVSLDDFCVEASSDMEAFGVAGDGIAKVQRKVPEGCDDVLADFTPATDGSLGWPCPSCSKPALTNSRSFNLMFETYVGALKDSGSIAYLRPETAQGIFANFKNVVDSSRVKVPFGIAQIGKAFRNEINPRNYTFRSREFEQMEIEFFCHPSEADRWYEYWRDLRYKWYIDLGLKSDKLRLRDHDPDELAHYARGCADVEYSFPFGVAELEGIANRTDFDLTAHKKHSGKDLSYFDDVRKERFIPFVIEPSSGVDRFALAIICEAYSYDESRASPEFMKFHPRLAPIKAAVFPLVAKDGMPDIAEPIYRDIKKRFPCQYDAKQSIGKRYARMDEAGTPFCFTIDGQTKEDGTVTVRNRDDAAQVRIDKSRCLEYLGERF